MADYLFDTKDGLIHTRFSELARCTPGQIDRVLAERIDGLSRFESDDMGFGTIRHDMWRQEALNTGKTAECFGRQWEATHIEREFATNIMPGVILHSRPDVVSVPGQAIIDYKTLIADSLAEGFEKAHRLYGGSRQLPTYGFQLGLHNIRIRTIVYLVEVWDRDRDNILGYVVVEKPLPMSELAKIVPWIEGRVSMLVSGLENRVVA